MRILTKKENLVACEKVLIFKIKKDFIEKIGNPENYDFKERIKLFEELKKGAFLKSKKKNLIVDIGKRQIGKILTKYCEIQSLWDDSGQTYPNKCALGTSDAGFTNSSTKLNNEVFRKNIASAQYTMTEFKIISWYTPSDCEGNFREEGIFFEGTDEKDSGILFSAITLTAAEGDKTSEEALLIERTFSL